MFVLVIHFYCPLFILLFVMWVLDRKNKIVQLNYVTCKQHYRLVRLKMLFDKISFSARLNPNNPVVILRSRSSLHSSDSADRGRSIIRVTLDCVYSSILKSKIKVTSSSCLQTSSYYIPHSSGGQVY